MNSLQRPNRPHSPRIDFVKKIECCTLCCEETSSSFLYILVCGVIAVGRQRLLLATNVLLFTTSVRWDLAAVAITTCIKLRLLTCVVSVASVGMRPTVQGAFRDAIVLVTIDGSFMSVLMNFFDAPNVTIVAPAKQQIKLLTCLCLWGSGMHQLICRHRRPGPLQLLLLLMHCMIN